jgi:2',3'-cyclic-nucleotide 2'-phosphodiesterase
MIVNVLCVGDVVGRAGRKTLGDKLPDLIRQRDIDFVVANAENIAGGSGITQAIYDKLLRYGVDVITMGDHVYRKKDVIALLETSDHIIRPANISSQAIGRQWTILPTKSKRFRAGVTCLLGQLYMGSNDSPWAAIDRVFSEMDPEVNIRIVDMHGEATSEKIAMGWYLNGRASIVFGTHTHVATADARVLDEGTAYITDLGMTGPYDGVLGRRKDRVLSFLTTSMPTTFEVCTGDPRLCGVLVGIDGDSGRAISIERIEIAGRPVDNGPYDADDGMPQSFTKRRRD